MSKFLTEEQENEVQKRLTTDLDFERVPMIGLLNERGLTGIGVEVGVWLGFFSDQILKNSNLSRLVSVDIWKKEIELVAATRVLDAHGERSVIMRTDSVVAASLFPDNSLDFVYIDTYHDAWNINRDIEAWYAKVKPGGMFSGHDYVPEYTDPTDGTVYVYGVIEAVNALVEREKLELHTIGTCKSWWVWKP